MFEIFFMERLKEILQSNPLEYVQIVQLFPGILQKIYLTIKLLLTK